MPKCDKSLILLEKDPNTIRLVQETCERGGRDFVLVSSQEEAFQKIEEINVLCLLASEDVLGDTFLAFGEQLRSHYPKVPFLPYLQEPGSSVGLQLLKGGARACLKSPLERKELSYHLSKTMAECMDVYSPFAMDYEERKVVVPNDLTMVMQVVQDLVHSTLPVDEKNRYPIILGLNEVLNNAIEHGNLGIDYEAKRRALKESKFFELAWERIHTPPYQDRRVTIVTRVSPTQGLVEFEITDEGEGFDWKEVLDNAEPENPEDFNGRGLIIVKHAFDEVCYNEKGNQVTLLYYTHKASKKAPRNNTERVGDA
jgi:anti-sigma regulatory factor (Ser/Thr protein kinase)